MTAAAVSLLYVAEVSLVGPWRWIAIAVGVTLLVNSSGREPRQFRRAQIPAAVLLALCATIASSPVLAVLAVLLLLPRARMTTAVALTLCILGLHLVWWRYASVFQLPRVPHLLASAVSALLGSAAHVTETGLIVRGQTVRFTTVPILAVLAPLLSAYWLRSTRESVWRVVLWSTVGLSAALAITVVFSLVGHAHFFSEPWWPLLPVSLGIAVASRLPGDHTDISQSWTIWTAAVVLVAVAWQAGFGPNQQRLRIAFDEAHGEWETSRASFNVSDYGRDTVYNYALLARWLGTKHDVSTLDSHWTQLATDVLIVKMPTEFYTADEKRAIDHFVREGGLLVAIGDHTNLYGTAFVINDLLRPYGLEIEASATVPWDGEHYDYRPRWWQQSRYLRGAPLLQFQTSATILARSPLVLPILVGDRVTGENADYSNDRFFADLHPGPEDRHPPLVLAAERRYGRGRAVLFADSTIFSTFSLMAPGNSELFQNLIEQGSNGRTWARVAVVILVLGTAVLLVRERRVVFALGVLSPVAALSLGVASSAPLERYPAPWVEVDARHSRLELRADPWGTHGPGFEDYSTFFAWIGRTGAIPRVTERAFLGPSTPTVIINPDREFSQRDIERIEHYLKTGGRLLLLDDPRFAVRSTAAPLLERFGVTLRALPGRGSIHEAGEAEMPRDLLALPFLLLRAGRRAVGSPRASGTTMAETPVGLSASLVDQDGAVVGGQLPIGRGLLIVFWRSVAFSEAVMGDVWVGQEIDPERRKLYQLGFDLVRLLTDVEAR